MTTKVAVISTIATILGALVIGLVILFLVKPSSRNAEMLGQGIGFATMAPLLVIWVLWADRFRKEREKRKRD